MFDDDDVRFSRGEDRPPWELTPSGRLREFFSCRSVEEAGSDHCREVDVQRKEREKAQKKRQLAHQALQAQRAARQQQMEQRYAAQRERANQAAHAVPAGDDCAYAHDTSPERSSFRPAGAHADPAAERYQYPDGIAPSGRPLRPRPRSGKSGKTFSLILALLAIIIAIVGMVANASSDSKEDSLPSDFEYDSEDSLPNEDNDRDFGYSPWGGFRVPGENSSEEAPAEESTAETTLDRADLSTPLTVELQSAAGLRPLTYQELYAKCAVSTVSIATIGDEGMGSGTGIVLTRDGYILTCNHVISGTSSCSVSTYDDQVYTAKLVGGDAQTDLAILKIDAKDLTPAEFGDSSELTVGDEALAIGDPLGVQFRGTLTNGIISAINRNVTVNNYSMTLIQTTAALNSGNSGGPLLNIYGQVIGVNNMKMISGSVTVEGLGFAVPTSVVREIVPVLSESGKVSRPVLGITCYTITEEMAELDDLPMAGLCVASVNSLSDAVEQGLETGDFITAVDGTPVTTVEEVKAIINTKDIGDSLDLSVTRYDEETETFDEMEMTITLMDQADMNK